MPRVSFFIALALLLSGCQSPGEQAPAAPASGSAVAANAPAPAKISSFQGPYRFLSNFYPAQVEFEGIMYPTAEHAYQAAKTTDAAERKVICLLATPAEAKAAGRALALRPDWEKAKLQVMEVCVRDKFTRNAELRSQLLATGNADLEEGNIWNDRFWGTVNGEGENHLGKILMQVRQELKPGA